MNVTHLTPPQLAARIHRSVGTLANWRSKKQGPAYESGYPVLYPIAAVEAWEREHSKGATP